MLKVNDNQYITCKLMLNLDYITYPNKIIENQPFFSRVHEMGKTFFSSIRHMKNGYYLKQPRPMCETNLYRIYIKIHNL